MILTPTVIELHSQMCYGGRFFITVYINFYNMSDNHNTCTLILLLNCLVRKGIIKCTLLIIPC